MQNLTYNIEEKDKDNGVGIEEIMSQLDINSDSRNIFCDADELMVHEINYDTNYTVKDIGNILDYYKFNKYPNETISFTNV